MNGNHGNYFTFHLFNHPIHPVRTGLLRAIIDDPLQLLRSSTPIRLDDVRPGGSRPEHGRSKTIVTSCCFLQRCQIFVFFLRSFLFFALYSLLNNAVRVVRSAASGCWAAHWLLKRSLVGLLKLTRLEVRPVIAIIGRFSYFFFSSLTLFRLFLWSSLFYVKQEC